jgi:hypothetical protein
MMTISRTILETNGVQLVEDLATTMVDLVEEQAGVAE